jgi:hypothetical protein
LHGALHAVTGWHRRNPQRAKALFGRLDRQCTELQRQLERTAVVFGELKVEKFAACGCFLVAQTVWAEKIQSTTDAGSLNTFGRN